MKFVLPVLTASVLAGMGCKPHAAQPTPTPTPAPSTTLQAAATETPRPTRLPLVGYHYQVPKGMRVGATEGTLMESGSVTISTKTIEARTAVKDVADSNHADIEPRAGCTLGSVHAVEIDGAAEAYQLNEECNEPHGRQFVYFPLRRFEFAEVVCDVRVPLGFTECNEFLKSIHVDAWRAVAAYTEDTDAITEDWNFYGNEIAEACKSANNQFNWISFPDVRVDITSGDEVVTTVDLSRPVMGFKKAWILISPGPKFQTLRYDPENVEQAKTFCQGG